MLATHFPISPRYQFTQCGPAIVTPGERRVLHLAERTNARYSPTGQLHRERLRNVVRGGQTDGRNFASDFIGAFQNLIDVPNTFDVDEPVQTGALKRWVVFEYHCPGGRTLADPLFRFR